MKEPMEENRLTREQLKERFDWYGTIPTPAEEDAVIEVDLERLGETLATAGPELVSYSRAQLRKYVSGDHPNVRSEDELPKNPIGDRLEVRDERDPDTGREVMVCRIIPRRPAPDRRSTGCPDPLIRVRALRPMARRRGAGRPGARRKTASASSGGSSDGSGSSDPGGAGDPDLEVLVLTDEKVGAIAVRLAIALLEFPHRGEIRLEIDGEISGKVERALEIALEVLRDRDLKAAGAPELFGGGYVVVIEDGGDE
jgi:hypothetical protein